MIELIINAVIPQLLSTSTVVDALEASSLKVLYLMATSKMRVVSLLYAYKVRVSHVQSIQISYLSHA